MTDRNYGSDERTELDRQSEHENHFSAQGETRGLFQKRRRVARSGQAAADPLSNKRRKQQQTAVALGVVGILGALSLWAVTSNPDERKTHKKPEPAASIAIHPEYVQRETYIRKSEAKIDELNNTVASLTSDIAALRKELESTAKSLTETMRRQKDTLATLEEVQAKHGAAIESAAEAAAASGGQMRAPGESGFDYGALDASLTGNAETRSGLLENSPGSTGRTQLTVVTLGAPKDRRTLPPAANTADERRLPRYAPSTWLAPDTPIAVNRAPGSTVDTYLPPGAFARATLLTGVYASTGGAAGDPMPEPPLSAPLDHDRARPWRGNLLLHALDIRRFCRSAPCSQRSGRIGKGVERIEKSVPLGFLECSRTRPFTPEELEKAEPFGPYRDREERLNDLAKPTTEAALRPPVKATMALSHFEGFIRQSVIAKAAAVYAISRMRQGVVMRPEHHNTIAGFALKTYLSCDVLD